MSTPQPFPVFAMMAIILFSPLIMSAEIPASAPREFAGKIQAAIGPLENIRLAFHNRSRLTALEADEAFQAVERELRSRGMRFADETEATARLDVTLSENPRNFLWIAEIQRDQAREMVMVASARQNSSPAAGPVSPMDLRLQLLMEQSDLVLDIAFSEGDLLVLDPGHLSRYSGQNDRWTLQNTASIPVLPSQPRDLRGKLEVSHGFIHAYLPGVLCSGTMSPSAAVDCVREDTPWPLEQGPAQLEAGKNSFVARGMPPFFSAVAATVEPRRLWVFAGVDGRTTLYDESHNPLGTLAGWGSDIAGADSACGGRRQVFVSLPGDPLEAGNIQAFELIRRQAVAVTPPVALPGPVTALWPLSSQDGVLAVSRNLQTGRYAAYKVSIVCGP